MKHEITESILDFDVEDGSKKTQIFYNGQENQWHDMPEFIQPQRDGYDIIRIYFDTEEEVDEFAREYLGLNNFWVDKIQPTKGIRWPLSDITRNSNLRVVSRQTAEANPDLYEIVSLDEIQP